MKSYGNCVCAGECLDDGIGPCSWVIPLFVDLLIRRHALVWRERRDFFTLRHLRSGRVVLNFTTPMTFQYHNHNTLHISIKPGSRQSTRWPPQHHYTMTDPNFLPPPPAAKGSSTQTRAVVIHNARTNTDILGGCWPSFHKYIIYEVGSST